MPFFVKFAPGIHWVSSVSKTLQVGASHSVPFFSFPPVFPLKCHSSLFILGRRPHQLYPLSFPRLRRHSPPNNLPNSNRASRFSTPPCSSPSAPDRIHPPANFLDLSTSQQRLTHLFDSHVSTLLVERRHTFSDLSSIISSL